MNIQEIYDFQKKNFLFSGSNKFELLRKKLLKEFDLSSKKMRNKKLKISNQTRDNVKIDNGLKLSVDLAGSNIVAYVAKKYTPVLNFSKIKSHKINDFWNVIRKTNKNNSIQKLK